uniref:coiled-coil domain-containing protein 15 isoform X2 n=1 Tax=Jaculus jaculus TaxID=51337 RepID=UPI001E1B214D|nr:coiled-coil domain-containing protein 15 isoform X2 [Jaculus jaculus]
MASLKKSRDPTRFPLALNPTKSKDVLAVLAERNQSIVPVGAWVEPASPDTPQIPAHTSAFMIEEGLKEQQRQKQESLKHFQRQVKHRVNQQIRLRKKQQLQKSYKAAEKEGFIVMQCSASAQLTPKRTSVFQRNLNAVIGSSRLPPSWMLGDSVEGGENQHQNELFQQAQALSQTMKQARHQLASFKTMSEKKEPVFLNGRMQSFPTQEEVGYQQMSFVMTDENKLLSGRNHQNCHSEDKDKPVSRVQKVKFKNPLFVVIKEEQKKQLNLKDLQDILPEAHDYLLEAQGDPPETQGDVIEVQSVEPEACSVELDTQVAKLDIHSVKPEGQAIKTETQNILFITRSIELDGDIDLEAQAFLPKCQDQDSSSKDHCVLKYYNTLPNYEDKNFPRVGKEFLSRNQHILPKEQNNLLKCQDEDSLPKDQNFLPEDHCALPENQYILFKHQDQDFLPEDEDFLLRDQHGLPKDQNVLPKCQDQDFLPSGQHVLPKDQNNLRKCQGQDLLPPNQHKRYGQASHDMTDEKQRKDLFPESHGYGFHEIQDRGSAREQSLYAKQRLSSRSTKRWQEDLHLDGHQHHPSSLQRDTCSRHPVYECQLGLSTESQGPLAFQSGVDQEEDKKERQKQYLRHRRLFMDIEREQAKEQQRQREQKKKVEKIKKKKEQQRYAEEQKMLRMNSHEVPYSGEKMSDILAQLQLDELQGARAKQQQKEKEYVRYVEALRAQVQKKMKLYNIILPPLCCCGPDFWDAHPDTCANNCIFYKNYRAYNRALHSIINSSDISEGTATLRNAIRNFACAHKRTSKRICNMNLKSAETTDGFRT